MTDIFAVSVNDAFVQKAFKKSLASEGTKVRFIADDTGAFTTALGLVFDASGLLGGLRAQVRSIHFPFVAPPPPPASLFPPLPPRGTES